MPSELSDSERSNGNPFLDKSNNNPLQPNPATIGLPNPFDDSSSSDSEAENDENEPNVLPPPPTHNITHQQGGENEVGGVDGVGINYQPVSARANNNSNNNNSANLMTMSSNNNNLTTPIDDDDVTTATAETDAVNNITTNRPPRLFMASITEEQSRRSLFNDYSSRSGKSLTAGSGGGGDNNNKSNRNIVGTNVQMAIEAERRERGLRGGSLERGGRHNNRSRSRSIGRQRSRSIDNRGVDRGGSQNQGGFYDDDVDPDQQMNFDPSIYTVGDSPNSNINDDDVGGNGGENPLDASTKSEKRVSFKSTKSSRGGGGMLALGPDSNLSPAEMEAERDPNISWRDGDTTSDDGIINNLDASHSSRTPHDHPHLEEDRHLTLANDKKKKQKKNKKQKKQFRGFIKKKKKKKSNNEMMPLEDGSTRRRKKRSSKFYVCVALLLVVLGGVIAGVVYMIQKMTSTNDNTQKNTSSTDNDKEGQQQLDNTTTINKLPWDAKTPCADFLIDVTTDKFGNETHWELYYTPNHNNNEQEEVTNGVLGRGEPILQEERKRLRTHIPKTNTDTTSFTTGSRIRRYMKRILQDSSLNNQEEEQLVLRNGPYTYLDDSDPTYIQDYSGQYTSKICLPIAKYKFVMYDINGDGLCCTYGLGEYTLHFDGKNGRDVHKSKGIFMDSDVQEFQVFEEDILTMKQDQMFQLDLSWNFPPPPPDANTTDAANEKNQTESPLSLSDNSTTTTSIAEPGSNGLSPSDVLGGALSPSYNSTLDTLEIDDKIPSNATNDTFVSSPSPSYTSTNDTLSSSSSPTLDVLSSNTSTALTISIPGNLTLTNLVYPPKTQEERTLIITVLEDIIQDVATKVLEKSDEEDVIIREVVILSINGEDVIVKEEQQQEEVSQGRDLQEATNDTIVEFDLKLEEPCTEDVSTCEDLVDTTVTYYEEIVAPYMTKQVADGSFTTALQENVQQNDEMSESDLFQDVEIVDGEFGVKVAVIDDDIFVPDNSTTVVNADVMGGNGTSTTTSLMPEVGSNIPTISPSSSSSTTDTTPSPSAMGGSNSSSSALPTSSGTTTSTTYSSTNSPSSKSSKTPTEMSLTSPPSPSPSKSLVTSEPTMSLTSSPPSSAEPTDSSMTVEPTYSPSTAEPTILSNANTSTPTSNPSMTLSSLAPTEPMIPTASPVFNPILEFTKSLVIEGTDDAAQFGFATAYSEDSSTLAVGSPAALNEFGDATGAVYLYSLDSFTSASTEDEMEEVIQSEPVQILYGVSPGDEFGHAVAISRDGKTLVVGSPSENELAGGVRIYAKRGGRFVLNGEFYGDYAEDQSGWSVSISGDGSIVGVGATGGGLNGGGLVTTYQYQAPEWVFYGSIVQALTSEDLAGYSLDLSYDGKFMNVGSRRSGSTQFRLGGKATVYAINDDGTEWVVRHEIAADGKNILDGTSVGLSQDGNVLVVGGNGYASVINDDPKRLAGRCKVYQWNEELTQYELVYTIIGQRKNEELGSSAAVSDDGNIIACGGTAGRWGKNNSAISGIVRLWDRSTSREKVMWPPGSRAAVEKGSFGSDISLSTDGNFLFVGASTWNGMNGNSPGAVHIFNTDW